MLEMLMALYFILGNESQKILLYIMVLLHQMAILKSFSLRTEEEMRGTNDPFPHFEYLLPALI